MGYGAPDSMLSRSRTIHAASDAAFKAVKNPQVVEGESEQASSQKLQKAISVGATIVSAFLGRKTTSATTIGRATTAARGVGKSVKESDDIERARQTVAAIDDQRKQLEDELREEVAKLEATTDVYPVAAPSADDRKVGCGPRQVAKS